jgi:hypothetical protein
MVLDWTTVQVGGVDGYFCTDEIAEEDCVRQCNCRVDVCSTRSKKKIVHVKIATKSSAVRGRHELPVAIEDPLREKGNP